MSGCTTVTKAHTRLVLSLTRHDCNQAVAGEVYLQNFVLLKNQTVSKIQTCLLWQNGACGEGQSKFIYYLASSVSRHPAM